MKVILKGYVDNLGDAGDIVDVANGYANNYLIPQKLALRATKGALADADALKKSRLKREALLVADAEAQAAGLAGKVLTIQATAGEDGTLYGSVGAREIAAAFTEVTGIEVTFKNVELDRPLKTVGNHDVKVNLFRDIGAVVNVSVEADEIIESGAEALEAALDEVDEADATVEEAAEEAADDAAADADA